MRGFASFLAASLALAGPVEATPSRVASLNLCTDELLLLIAAPGQIASVTHLSHRQPESPLWRRARRFPRNDGSLLSVASVRPDLVLTMGGAGRDRAGIARRLGITIIDLPHSQSLDDVEASIRTVAAGLDRPRRGEELIGHMRRLRATAPAARVDTIWLGGGGRSLPVDGLGAEWMALAGFRQRPLRGDRVSLEELLVRPPETILRSDYRQGQYSGEQNWLTHPLARRVRASQTVATDGRLWTCMGPLMIDEVVRLRRELAR
jgi:iron complex transport system substrate-binding protein